MAMKITTVHNKVGLPQEQLFMRNWLSTSTTNEIKIPEDWVISISTPTEDVDKEYQKNLSLEDIEPPAENIAGLPESYLKMLEEIQQEEQKLLSDLNKPKDKSILINMALPPEVFMEMLPCASLPQVCPPKGFDWFTIASFEKSGAFGAPPFLFPPPI